MSSSGTISFLLEINFSLGKTLRALDSLKQWKVNGFTGNSDTDNFSNSADRKGNAIKHMAVSGLK
jgi:hypothetical protein